MFKVLATLAALFGLSTASTLEIPLSAWSKVLPKESAVKMQLYGAQHPTLKSIASGVTWSECNSEHVYDVACGTAKPNPPIVGDWVGLNMDIIFNNDADVTGNFISVAFTAQNSKSPIPLYSQDFNSGQPGQYGAGDEYTDALTWFVPGFAPLGHYNVTIEVHDQGQKQVYACIQAEFDIYN
ncbi:hypothetical protein FGO68_gene9615 [Halteria grandinella]|uniref:MD-2-related lipid-recognition domain-containing protein n=1 Tax=Halteria grandinella TaxID=5974 RepID=A0A8J8NJN1_HALGN|nr:hypothetical protein FGO68_gene9615 [Halteria grandinella]